MGMTQVMSVLEDKRELTGDRKTDEAELAGVIRTTKVRCAVCSFLKTLWNRHVVAALKHPHEYIVALILTIIFILIGQADRATITGTWLFALVESVVSGGGDA